LLAEFETTSPPGSDKTLCSISYSDNPPATVKITPITLEGKHVILSPLTQAHADALVVAASDGELWNTQLTIIPDRASAKDYIQFALDGLAQEKQLPFVIMRKSKSAEGELRTDSSLAGATEDGALLAQPSARAQSDRGDVVGSTRFYEIRPNDRAAAIGYTWLAKSAQRTPINTECKLLLLTHAFEHWQCHRVELITDVLNEQSRAAILRLGAKQEGILRKHLIMPSGRSRDSVVFSILDDEWPEVKPRLRAKLGLETE
jgi:N-acetyltransferase